MPRDFSRDPCPWVILNDAGGAFVMGAVGGCIWHFIKGARNAPRGERIYGAFTSMKTRGPVVGGSFGIWGGLFSTFDCAFAGIRQKEDAWNSIVSGAASGAVLSARSGWKMALSSAVFGGLVLAMIEGVGVLLNRQGAEMTRPQAPILPPELIQQAQLQHAS